jgi:hypothetical protein
MSSLDVGEIGALEAVLGPMQSALGEIHWREIP